MSDGRQLPDSGGSDSEIILYQTEDKKTQIDVRLEGETVWLSQKQMAELLQTSVPNVNIHLRNIFEEGELQEEAVIKRGTASDRQTAIQYPPPVRQFTEIYPWGF